MRYLRLARLTAIAATPLVLVGAGATSAFAAGSTSGTVNVWSVQKGNAAAGPILFTGAVGDYGTATSQDKNGKVDPNGSYVKMALKKGTFFVNAVSLNNVLDGASPTYNPTNCSGSFSGTGPHHCLRWNRRVCRDHGDHPSHGVLRLCRPQEGQRQVQHGQQRQTTLVLLDDYRIRDGQLLICGGHSWRPT